MADRTRGRGAVLGAFIVMVLMAVAGAGGWSVALIGVAAFLFTYDLLGRLAPGNRHDRS